MQIKTFKIGVDSDDSINEFIAGIRLIKDGVTVTQDGWMQILYTPKETPKEQAERLNGPSKEVVVATLIQKLTNAENKYIDHLVMIEETQITLDNMQNDPEKKATQDLLDKQNNYLAALLKEKAFMEQTLAAVRKMILDVQNDVLVV